MYNVINKKNMKQNREYEADEDVTPKRKGKIHTERKLRITEVEITSTQVWRLQNERLNIELQKTTEEKTFR